MKYLYKYPQASFPYARLVEENGRRSTHDFEYELLDTGVFDEDRYFDIVIEYAKRDARGHLRSASRRSTAAPSPRRCTSCPHLWFRNTWPATSGRTRRRPEIVRGPIGRSIPVAPDLRRRSLHYRTTVPGTYRLGPRHLYGPHGGPAPVHRQRDERARVPWPRTRRAAAVTSRTPSIATSSTARALHQPRANRHQGRLPLRLSRDPARRLGRPPAPPDRPADRGTTRWPTSTDDRPPPRRGRRVLRRHPSARGHRTTSG